MTQFHSVGVRSRSRFRSVCSDREAVNTEEAANGDASNKSAHSDKSNSTSNKSGNSEALLVQDLLWSDPGLEDDRGCEANTFTLSPCRVVPSYPLLHSLILRLPFFLPVDYLNSVFVFNK